MNVDFSKYNSISFGTDISRMSNFLSSAGGVVIDSYYVDSEGERLGVKGFHISEHSDVKFTLSSSMNYIDIEILRGQIRRVFIDESSDYNIEGLTWNSNNIYYIAEVGVNQNRVYSNGNYNILNLNCSVSPLKKTLYSYYDNRKLSIVYNRLLPSGGYDYIRDFKNYNKVYATYSADALVSTNNSAKFTYDEMESLIVPEMYTVGYVKSTVDIINYTEQKNGIVNLTVNDTVVKMKKTVYNHYISI